MSLFFKYHAYINVTGGTVNFLTLCSDFIRHLKSGVGELSVIYCSAVIFKLLALDIYCRLPDYRTKNHQENNVLLFGLGGGEQKKPPYERSACVFSRSLDIHTRLPTK